MMVWPLDHQIHVLVGGKFDCFMFCFSIAILIFISLTKNVLAFSKTGCYVFSSEFSNAHGWVDEVEFEVEAGTGLRVHDVCWPSGWEACTGDPDGASCLPDI